MEVVFGMIVFGVFASLENVLLPRTHQTFNRPDGSIGKTADGVQFDLSTNLHQHVHFSFFQLATFHSAHDVVNPRQALTARSALTAGFVHVEVREVADGGDLFVRVWKGRYTISTDLSMVITAAEPKPDWKEPKES